MLTVYSFMHVLGKTDTTKTENENWIIGTILLNQSSDFRYEQTFVNFFDGIVVRKKFGQYKSRFAVEYVSREYKVPKILCCDRVQAEGIVNEGLVRVGLEKQLLTKGGFATYFAVDAAGLVSRSDLHFFGDVRYHRSVTRSVGFGLMPALGFSYSINKHLAIGLETRGKFMQTRFSTDFFDRLYPWWIQANSKHNALNNSFEGVGAFTLNIKLP